MNYEQLIKYCVHFSAFMGKVIDVKNYRKKVRYLVENMYSLKVWMSITVIPESHEYSCKAFGLIMVFNVIFVAVILLDSPEKPIELSSQVTAKPYHSCKA